MSQEKQQDQHITIKMLKEAFAKRADVYAHMFDVLKQEYDTEKAVEPIAKATVRLGIDMGEKFAHLGPFDLPGHRAIDDGLFTRAGFIFKGKTWKPGQKGCCLLIVEPGASN